MGETQAREKIHALAETLYPSQPIIDGKKNKTQRGISEKKKDESGRGGIGSLTPGKAEFHKELLAPGVTGSAVPPWE